MTDHERPLNKRGRQAADAVARVLNARGYAPDVIWSSDSERTMETARRLIRVLPGAQKILHNSALYHASSDHIMNICKHQTEPDGVSCLMILAHNPGMSDLYRHWTGQDHRFPTGCCAVFKRIGDGPWTHPKNWRAIDLILPREIETDS